ncbi:RelA/SpoT family protein [Rickettsia endosymbiont of Cardiosporidium cionae]|uniref:RelA/SpoT family protein n=1 Tax=Rickettsia endosymbiont of Cardiosporidium cionae TaxID=2777155 RepID=UPI001895CAE8|nr:RelA/SpoT family protein [Rickettsia endosymbiont of Cardiosporidium cionae]KAF8818351.1 hypothetical protein IHI24_000813 [Rickettsia endosymbiont of Cardiosporidium cionae]
MLKYKKIIERYMSSGCSFNEELVDKALDFAIHHHGSQLRASGEFYYQHPIEVAYIISQMQLDTCSIVTAILHDLVEDTEIETIDIERIFGLEIANLVDGVTKLTKMEFIPDNVRQAENFRKLLLAMSGDIRVLIVKLADRLHNMRTIDYLSCERKKKLIAIETMEIYSPLAERIGIQKIKTELQDISFRILYPDIRNSIIDQFLDIEQNKDHFINKIIKDITSLLKSSGIDKFQIHGRKKTPYSSWMKMQQKNVGLEQLSDIIAFRIITDTVIDCYKILGVIHTSYTMVPGNFQDFISIPKNNGYRSIHTVVIGPFSQRVEIQIRTKSMHEIAELGVAAHWIYKQNNVNAADGKQYLWIRELLSILEHNRNPEEFFHNTKLSMHYDQIFCFTPKGSIIALPQEATVVDFAYAVHSDIGDFCLGAVINGKDAKLNSALSNGDQVKIITSNCYTISAECEKFVITGKARSGIRKILKLQRFSESAYFGKNIALLKENQDDLFVDSYKQHNTSPHLREFSVLGYDESLFGSSDRSMFNNINLSSVLEMNQNLPIFSNLPLSKLNTSNSMDNSYMFYSSKEAVIASYLENRESVDFKDVLVVDNCSEYSNSSIFKVKMFILNKPRTFDIIISTISRYYVHIVNMSVIDCNTGFFEILFDLEVDLSYQIEQMFNYLRLHRIVERISYVEC